jgi:hypothetical protein
VFGRASEARLSQEAARESAGKKRNTRNTRDAGNTRNTGNTRDAGNTRNGFTDPP